MQRTDKPLAHLRVKLMVCLFSSAWTMPRDREYSWVPASRDLWNRLVLRASPWSCLICPISDRALFISPFIPCNTWISNLVSISLNPLYISQSLGLIISIVVRPHSFIFPSLYLEMCPVWIKWPSAIASKYPQVNLFSSMSRAKE